MCLLDVNPKQLLMAIDKEEFRRLILPCGHKMFATARTILGNDDEASDAVQQAMLRIWEQRDSITGLKSPEAFCVTVVKRICLNVLRDRKIMEDESRLLNVEDDASGDSDYESDLKILGKLLRHLPDSQRKVLELSVFGDCSNDEIANITGESASNVRQLLSRARKKLKSIYRLSYEY